MQYPYSVEKAQSAQTNFKSRTQENKGAANAWGDKLRLGLSSEHGNPSATQAVLRYRWLDTYRQNNDSRYNFFLQSARENQPFRNNKRPYRF
jgi:hypothetical protein